MESSQEDNHENIKLQNEVLLAEYNMLRDAVLSFRQMQGQLDNLALTALGLSIPLILVILERSLDAIGVILFLPMLFFAIAFVQLRHERQINLDSIYVDANLRPQINELLSKVSAQEVSVLEYERFLAAHYFAPNLLTQWVITTSRGGISLAIGLLNFEKLMSHLVAQQPWTLLGTRFQREKELGFSSRSMGVKGS
jgi:hypothetical protein